MKKNIHHFIFFISIVLSLNSCIAYKQGGGSIGGSKSISEISTDEYNFYEFIDNIDTNKQYLKPKNRLLYLLEKGKIEHYNGNYAESNQYFEDAYFMIENEALNSKSGKVLSYITNGEASDYRAEDFEKTALLYYKAINFFQLGDYDSALVEAKRINIKLNALNNNYKEGKNKYSEDAFSQILMGIIYEAKNDFNNAFIAYRNAADIYLNNSNTFFETTIPHQLKIDVVRTAKILNFSEEANRYKSIFNLNEVDIDTKKKEAIVFWENGLGPYKGQTKISAGAVDGFSGGSFENEEMGIVIPIPAGIGITGFTSLAIPKYIERQPYYTSAEVLLNNGKTVPLEPVENYSAIAKQCLKDRMGREVVQSVVRATAKTGISKGAGIIAGHFLGSLGQELTEAAVGIAGVLVEKADRRNWNSLPNTINYARLTLNDNQKEITLRLKADTQVDEVNLPIKEKSGIQIFNQISFSKMDNLNPETIAYSQPTTSSITQNSSITTESSSIGKQEKESNRETETYNPINTATSTQVGSMLSANEQNFKDTSKRSFGLIAGYCAGTINLPSNYYFESDDSYLSDFTITSETLGYKAGLFIDTSEDKKLYSYFEIFYSYFSNEYEDAFGDTGSLSLLIGLPIGSNKFSLLGGVQMNYCFDADYYAVEELYYHASLGCRYKIYKNSFLKIDYNLPISNMNFSDETLNYSFVGVSLGLAFK